MATKHEELQRDEFLRSRTVVGASEVAAVMGHDPFATPADIYDRLVKLVDHDIVEEAESFHIERGQDCEPIAAARIQKQYGVKLMNQSAADVCPGLECLRSNPDRVIVGQQELCEIKTPSPHSYKLIREHGFDGRTHWTIQGQAQLACRPRMKAMRWGLHSVDPWETVLTDPLERHDEYIEEVLKPAVRFFWEEHFLPRTRPTEDYPEYEPPPAWGGEIQVYDGNHEWIEKTLARHDDILMEALLEGLDRGAVDDGLIAYLIQHAIENPGLYGLMPAKTVLSLAEQLHARARVQVEEFLGDVQVAEGHGVRISFKYQQGRVSLDRKRLDMFLLENTGARLEDFERRGEPFRVFRPTTKKESE